MAGLNLLDMISQAGGGQARQQLGAQLGLDAGQTEQVLKALLPALSAGLKANVSKPGGAESLLKALQGGHHQQYLDQPETLAQPETINDGNAILGHLFGSKEVSREVAGAAAQRTGVGEQVLKAALPMIASMVMGSLSKQTNDPNIAGQLLGMLGGAQPQPAQSQGQGLGALLGGLLGGGRQQAAPAAPQQGQGGMLGALGNLLDADGDGSPMDDIFKMVMSRRS